MTHTPTNASGKVVINSSRCHRFDNQKQLLKKKKFKYCEHSEQLFKNAADYIVSDGYKDAGYEYVIIDDCWMEKDRDPITKQLVPDRKRFPNGMKALADYVRI